MRLASLLLLASCGAGQSATATATAAGSDTATATVTATATGMSMKEPTPTAYAEQLSAIGLDPAHLPPLKKVPADQLRKLMPLFAKSLGIKCDGCHDMDDPPKRTVRKDLAAFMWGMFVMKDCGAHPPPGLACASGPVQPIFCDSCHHGSLRVLDRSDDKALRAWMDASFVHELGAEGCPTCHGEPFNPHLIHK